MTTRRGTPSTEPDVSTRWSTRFDRDRLAHYGVTAWVTREECEWAMAAPAPLYRPGSPNPLVDALRGAPDSRTGAHSTLVIAKSTRR